MKVGDSRSVRSSGPRKGSLTGGIEIQRKLSGGLKAVTQFAKGLQEIFIRTEAGVEDAIAAAILKL